MIQNETLTKISGQLYAHGVGLPSRMEKNGTLGTPKRIFSVRKGPNRHSPQIEVSVNVMISEVVPDTPVEKNGKRREL
jgi:hypothetical protein